MSRYLQAYFTLREHFPETEFTTREARLVLSKLSDAHVWKILKELVKRKYIKHIKHAIYRISSIEQIAQGDTFQSKNRVQTLLKVLFHPKVIITGSLASQFLTQIIHTSDQIDLLVEKSSLKEIRELLIPSSKLINENTFELFSKHPIKVRVVITPIRDTEGLEYLTMPLFGRFIKISKPEKIIENLIRDIEHNERNYNDISFLIARDHIHKDFVFEKYPKIKSTIERSLNSQYFYEHYLTRNVSNEQTFLSNLFLAWEELNDYKETINSITSQAKIEEI